MKKPHTYKGATAVENDSLAPYQRTIRKMTPKHLGRRTKEEQDVLAKHRLIHAPRKLRDMLATNGICGTHADLAMKTFDHWLRDLEHERRIANELDDQDLISRLIQTLERQ